MIEDSNHQIVLAATAKVENHLNKEQLSLIIVIQFYLYDFQDTSCIYTTFGILCTVSFSNFILRKEVIELEELQTEKQ